MERPGLVGSVPVHGQGWDWMSFKVPSGILGFCETCRAGAGMFDAPWQVLWSLFSAGCQGQVGRCSCHPSARHWRMSPAGVQGPGGSWQHIRGAPCLQLALWTSLLPSHPSRSPSETLVPRSRSWNAVKVRPGQTGQCFPAPTGLSIQFLPQLLPSRCSLAVILSCCSLCLVFHEISANQGTSQGQGAAPYSCSSSSCWGVSESLEC